MQEVGIHHEVSERAVLRRVNRALAHQGLRVRKTVHGSRAEFDLGEYFEVDTSHGGCTCANIDLESWARDLGVLKDYETMQPDTD